MLDVPVVHVGGTADEQHDLVQVYLLDVLSDLLRNTMLNIMINGQAVSIFQVIIHDHVK